MHAPTNLRAIALATATATLIAFAPALASAGDGTGGIGTDPGPGTGGGGGGAEAKSGGVFPVRAPHTYGDGIGAGRGHQGQDLLAKCGKPVVAAQAGKVRYIDYQASGAGNYLVIKSKQTGFDYVYMHLAKRPSASRGDKVDAGEQLGVVGTTGSSTACHLHFEMWTKPGWYRGGDVADPKPYLKAWDRSS
jgi:murein DD-endopeptidase MepM/ murein hydrolase activator NlpD